MGTTCATCIVNNNNTPKGGGGGNQVMNGNGFIANSYAATACGLNYVIGKVKLGKRLPTPGVNQPAAISITGLPICKTILKAFLYTGGSGNGINVNATVTNPAATSSVFAMTQIGNHVDKCWGYAGTFNYRADITALITGNGNYMVSGIPTNPPTAGNDMDGASIVIVYSDPTQLFTGHIVIGDGCQVGIGGQQTSNITGWNACAASTFASAFMIVGDLQNVGIANCFMNSAANNFNYPSASQDWWDNIVMNPAPNVFGGQNSTTFGVNSGGDCFNIVAAGLYYRTGCNVCTVGGMTVTTATTSSCTVGSATAFVTGGSAPYSYTWTPTALTTSAITNVPTGTYTVTVKDASGCLTGTAIAVIPATNATIAVNSATICAGKSATLTAQGGNTYTWTPNATLSSGNGNPVIATPAATTIYTVSTTNSLGCVGTTTATVVVNPLPVVTPTATSPVCSGNPINLGVGASTSYTWAGPNAFASNLQNPTIAPSTTLNSGNYSVTVTNASGCTASNVVNVLVNPTPTITPGNFGPYCAGATINLTVAAQSSYTWSGPNGFSSNAQNPAIANSQTVNSGIYSVTVSSAAGCIGTGTTNVIVNPKPTPTITSNSPLCQGSTLNLFANPAVSTYTWSGPNSFASNLQNPSVANVQTVSTGNYTVIVTTTAGCTGSATAFVQVNPTPTIAAGNTGPYCAGATINLTVSPSNTFTWTGPSAFSSNVQNPTIANSQTVNSGSYSVTIATAAGCTNNAVTNVVVNALPTPTATSNSPVCVGKPLNLTGLGGTTYTWTGPGGFSSNTQNPSIATASLANVGNYTLVVTNANGCTNSVVTNVVINTLPVIVVNSPTSCVGSSFTLTASGGTAYAWTGPNSYNSALQNPPFATASTSLNGNYTVVVTSAQGCTNNAVANVVVVTLPTVSIAGNNVICSQNFNSSINTTTLTASGANSYTWTLPTGFGGSPNLNTTPLVVTPSVTSLQTIATVSVIGSAGTCTSSAVFNLTINPNPTITVSSGSMCAGTSVNLTSSGASTYTWSPSTALNTTNGPNVIANPSVITVYSVIGSSLGCNSQTQNGTATVVPNPTVTINPNPAAICLGNNINLTASGATTYTWSPNIALTTTLGPNTTANPTITTTYSVLGSQATCTHVAAITVSVLGLPSVTITPSSPTLCMNNFNGSPNTVTLNASGAASYTWGPIIGLTTNTLNGNSIIGTSNGAAAISGTVIGANGTCTNLATFTLNAIANPTIAVTSGSMCAGTSVTLTSSGAST
ncbi:MAG: beta strand repeat-containing protein [Sphingobacteriaceae bacterium]